MFYFLHSGKWLDKMQKTSIRFMPSTGFNNGTKNIILWHTEPEFPTPWLGSWDGEPDPAAQFSPYNSDTITVLAYFSLALGHLDF